MPRAPQPRHYRPKDSCTFDFDGTPVVLRASEIFAADNPIVRARPELFTPLEPARDRPAVEQATAAPGERRGGQ